MIISSEEANSVINKSSVSLVEEQLSLNNEEMIKMNLNKFLKAHDIKDGNMVETRKLDLRQAQKITKPAQVVKKKQLNPVEAFLSMRVDKKVSSRKIKFLNDRDTTSSESESSDDDDDDDNKVMGIELYRQQKRMAQKLQSDQNKSSR